MLSGRAVIPVLIALLGAAQAGAPTALALAEAQGRAQEGPGRPRGPLTGSGPWEFETADYRIRVVKMVDGLERPWGLAFLPDGAMLITERPGRLRIVRDGILDQRPITGVPKVFVQNFDGLLDIALHPRFAENRLVYLSYSKPSTPDGGGLVALARGRYDGGHELTEVEDIFVGTGTSPRNTLQSVLARLVFGRDGMLYMTSGTPNNDRFQAQDPTSHRCAYQKPRPHYVH